MTLKAYKKKRNFCESSEPEGIKNDSSKALHFCVQKHNARNLHYDFRLEYKCVLRSWAIPKGPSLNPEDKRPAIMVEYHPLEYQFFEGIIPKGNYGAGTVEIWDRGIYTLPENDSVKEIEKKIEVALQKGHLTFVLRGEKLQGTFTLQKLKSDSEDRSWLLIKKKEKETSGCSHPGEIENKI